MRGLQYVGAGAIVYDEGGGGGGDGPPPGAAAVARPNTPADSFANQRARSGELNVDPLLQQHVGPPLA